MPAAANQYSRREGERYTQPRAKKRRRRRIVLGVFVTLFSLLAIGGGVAWAYINMLNHNLSEGLDSAVKEVLVTKDTVEEPFYMLLLGTDQDLTRTETNVYNGAYRTDTIILARIDPKSKKATLVSIPRDTRVEIEGHGQQKINAAYTFGGVSATISTVSKLAGVDITHFALVDMDGLAAVVDALGGIEVDVTMEIDDEYTGHLDAGLQTLDGQQALIYARSRHNYDKVGDGDEYRAANQRTVISAISNKLLASDVGTIANTVSMLSTYVQSDMNVADIVSLAQTMKGMSTEEDLYSATMPNTPVYENEVWWTDVNWKEWNTMMQRVDEGLSPTEETVVDKSTGITLSNAGDGGTDSPSTSSASASDMTYSAPKTGSIYVRNGTAVSGLAAEAADALTKVGYTVTETGNADSDDYAETIVVYEDDSQASEAQEIAGTVAHNAKVVKNDGKYNLLGDFLVVIGANYSS